MKLYTFTENYEDGRIFIYGSYNYDSAFTMFAADIANFWDLSNVIRVSATSWEYSVPTNNGHNISITCNEYELHEGRIN